MPVTWFNFEIDTLYLDWGWHGFSGLSFDAGHLGDVASQVKHLAIYHSPQDLQLRGMGDPEELLCEILVEFCNLETLTLVNRRHNDRVSDLVFMNPMDLLIWQPFQCQNIADIDIAKLDEWIEKMVGRGRRRIADNNGLEQT